MVELTKQELDQAVQSEGRFSLYLYTPFCGTCQLAKRMLTIVEEALPEVQINSSNLNYLPEHAAKWEIESVPCLLLFEDGKLMKKVYAFQSVEYLYQLLK
ncbi:thioredoxin family protein [Metabacillus sp. GX 13764]|uniref:thioredoxin family protein n=1 Tax=Metabacillus kandeliae TaxID=2900151 RepID=UPI001E2CE333|nr:thioredoxin family protein [Metabacillus kandeliae]MCD7036288.1 thioredoxin family protein [Metabacillus kandeliae]